MTFTENDFIRLVSDNLFDSVCNYESDFSYFDLSKIKRVLPPKDKESAELVGNIMNLSLVDNKNTPYQPMAIYGNRRSFAVEDITEELADTLFNSLEKIPNAIIRARIADVLWVRRLPKGKGFSCAQIAISAYYEAIDGWLKNNQLHSASDAISRLHCLSLLLKGAPEREKWFTELPKLISMEFNKDNETSFFYWRKLLTRVADVEWKKDHKNVVLDAINKTENIIAIALEKQDYHWARYFYSIEIRLTEQIDESNTAIIELRKKSAKTYELEMALFDNQLQQTHFLTEAIKAYMAIPGCQQDVARLIKQKESMHRVSEMYHTTFSQEIPKEYIDLANNVRGKSFPQAILELSELILNTIVDCSNPATLNDSTQKNTSIMYKIASLVSLDSMGHVRKVYSTEEENHNKEMIDHMLIGNSIGMLPVLEAIKIINLEHFYSLNDIIALVRNSAFVPQKHILTMSRGVEAFLRDDMLSAAHFLILPFEDCIRNQLFLRQNTTKTKGDGSEENIVTLENLIDNCQKERIFDETFAYLFKSYLVDKELNFRNLIAHGMLSHREYNDNRLRTLCAVILLTIFYVQTIEYIKSQNSTS